MDRPPAARRNPTPETKTPMAARPAHTPEKSTAMTTPSSTPFTTSPSTRAGENTEHPMHAMDPTRPSRRTRGPLTRRLAGLFAAAATALAAVSLTPPATGAQPAVGTLAAAASSSTAAPSPKPVKVKRWKGYRIHASKGPAGKWIGGYKAGGHVAYVINPAAAALARSYSANLASMETVKGVSATRLHQAAWILSTYGDVDATGQPAAVDAAVTQLLGKRKADAITGHFGSTRLKQTKQAKPLSHLARKMLAQAKQQAGPYDVDIEADTSSLADGGDAAEVPVTVTVTSASGHAVKDGIHLDVAALPGPVTVGPASARAVKARTATKQSAVRVLVDATDATSLAVTVTGIPATTLSVMAPAEGKHATSLAAAGLHTAVAKTIALPQKLTAPTTSAKADSDGNVTLTWPTTGIIGGATLTVWRSDDGGTDWIPIKTGLDPSTGTWTDASANSTSIYVVQVITEDGSSPAPTPGSTDGAVFPAPPAPTGGAVQSNDDGGVTVSWSAVTGADHYVVWKSTDGAGKTWAIAHTTTDTSWVDPDGTSGFRYWIEVVTKDGASSGQPKSGDTGNIGSTPPSGPPVGPPAPSGPSGPTAPSSPTGTTVTYDPGTDTSAITWNPSSGADSYTVERSEDGGATYSVIGTVTAPTTTFTDPDPVAGGTYAIVAHSSAGDSPAPSGAGTAPSVPPAPSAPTLDYDPATGHIAIDWTGTGADTFWIWRSNDGGLTFSHVGTVTAPTTEWVDPNPGPDAQYFIQGRATMTGNSPAPGTGGTVGTALPTPTSPATDVTYDATSGGMRVTWDDVDEADSYAIFRTNDGGANYTQVATVPAGTDFWVDPSPGTSPGYYVRPVSNLTGSAPAPSGAGSSTSAAAPAETVITSVVYDGATGAATITWPAATDVSSREVWLSVDGGTNWSDLDTVSGASSTSYVDVDAGTRTTPSYRVQAINPLGNSGVISGTTNMVPLAKAAAPTGLAATYSGVTGKVTLAFTPVTAADGYQVFRSNDGGANFSKIADLAGSTTGGYIDNTPGTDPIYQVKSVNPAGVGASSSSAGITAPGKPTGQGASYDATTGTATVSWTAVPTADSYQVYRSNNGSTWTKIADVVGQASNSFADTEPGTTPSYLVEAVNIHGVSGTATADASAAVTPSAPGMTLLNTLTAAYNSDGSTAIAWDFATAGGADTATLYRTNDGGTTWTKISDFARSTSTYHDTTPGSEPGYYLIASNVAGSSAAAPSTTGMVTPAPLVPGSQAAAFQSDGSVKVTWAQAVGADGYYVWKSAGGTGANWTKVATISSATTLQWAGDSTPGTDPAYFVQAYSLRASSTAPSGTASNVWPSIVASTGLTVTYDGTQAYLDWTSGTTGKGVDGYDVWRYNGTSWSKISTLTGTSTTYLADASGTATSRYVLQSYGGGSVVSPADPTGTTGVTAPTIADAFTGTGALGTAQTGGQTWQFYNSTSANWTRNAGGYITASSVAASANPMAVIGVGQSNATVTVANSQPGAAIYARVSDGANWLRLRVNETQTYHSSGYYDPDTVYYSHQEEQFTQTYSTTGCTGSVVSSTSLTNVGAPWVDTNPSVQDGFTSSCSGKVQTLTGYANSVDHTVAGAYHDTSYYTYAFQEVLEKDVAGTVTQLGSWAMGSSLPAYCRLAVEGSTLNAYYGASTTGMTLAGSVTDAFNSAATLFGVGLSSSSYATGNRSGALTSMN